MRKIALAAACSAIALSATPVVAQTSGLAEEAEQQDELAEGDIIVTANRTQSLLSKTPLAITAVTGDALLEEGIVDPTNLNEVIPNLSIDRNSGLQITIRGVSSADQTEKGDPSAAFNLNGVYISRPQQQDVSFFDIERVEVLRGPQGTLYGRNATAGVVNVITTRPKFDFGGSVDAVYGNFDKIFATAVLNLPASDTIAFRVAANIDQRDTYIIDGAPNDGHDYAKFKDNKAVRLSALFEPTPDLSIYLVGDYSHQDGDNVNTILNSNFVPASNFYDGVNTAPPLTQVRYIDTNDRAQRTNPTPFSQNPFGETENYGITGELVYQIGDASITYLGGYRKTDNLGVGVLTNGARQADFAGTFEQQSHELRFAYNAGPLQAQVGAYYFKENADSVLNLPRPGAILSFAPIDTSARNQSLFGQVTYEIVPNLRLTGGIRYSDDRKSRNSLFVARIFDFVNSSTDFGTELAAIPLSTNIADVSFDKVTWRLGVDYDTSLGLIYAAVSTGYKAGGFNDGCAEPNNPVCTVSEDLLFYSPESLTSYEAGFRFRFSPEFQLNGTVFHYDYSDLQLTQLVLNIDGQGNNGQVTTNAATAKIDGVELDAVLRPGDRWTFNLAFNYLDARYNDFVPGALNGVPVQLGGTPLNRSPKTSGRFAVNYALPVGDGEIDFNAATRFSAEYDLSNNFTNFRRYRQPSYTKTDLSVTYKAPGDRFYVGAYVENLEDDLVVTVQNAPQTVIFADPRTYGVRAGVKF